MMNTNDKLRDILVDLYVTGAHDVGTKKQTAVPDIEAAHPKEASDLSSWMKNPHYIAVDAKGYVWRAYTDEKYWSMAPVNPDNSPIPEPITYYKPVFAGDRAAAKTDQATEEQLSQFRDGGAEIVDGSPLVAPREEPEEHIFLPVPNGTAMRCSCGKTYHTTAEQQQHRDWHLALGRGFTHPSEPLSAESDESFKNAPADVMELISHNARDLFDDATPKPTSLGGELEDGIADMAPPGEPRESVKKALAKIKAQSHQQGHDEGYKEGLRTARDIVLKRTEIPADARRPTRDAVVILGEEIARLITEELHDGDK